MLKYIDVKETFSEVPNEISLTISISGCPIHCKGCHSQYLWKDEGKELNWESLNSLICQHYGITCICLMGGDQSPKEVNDLAYLIKKNTNLKVAWYSGLDKIADSIILSCFDYIKVGHYDERLGPLTSKSTNQCMYKIDHTTSMEDISYMFIRND